MFGAFQVMILLFCSYNEPEIERRSFEVLSGRQIGQSVSVSEQLFQQRRIRTEDGQ